VKIDSVERGKETEKFSKRRGVKTRVQREIGNFFGLIGWLHCSFIERPWVLISFRDTKTKE